MLHSVTLPYRIFLLKQGTDLARTLPMNPPGRSGAMARTGVIWRLQRGAERYEALVLERPAGHCELQYLLNGTLLERLWLAAGRGLAALEDAVHQRDRLKAAGWRELAEN